MTNRLYFGDNLDILRSELADNSVDLIYLDPPFNSKRTYNLFYKNRYGVQLTAQKEAFEDTWRWDEVAQAAYQELIRRGEQGVIEFIQYLLSIDRTQSQSVPSYVVFMSLRLVELHRILKKTGSIYLHCDPTMSHYLKIVLDAIFGRDNFQNEIVWAYKERELSKKHWNRKHDIILFYAKNIKSSIFNYDKVLEPYSKVTLKKFKYKDEKGYYRIRSKDGRSDVEEGENTYRQYVGKGVLPRDWWQIPILNQAAKERLGYPTQKPESLLERIILASSNENDIVLDPFCGCGTTIAVAHRLKRQWIGVDVTHVSIQLIEKRLQDSFPGIEYDVQGIPRDVASAKNLAKRDRYAFEDWSLSVINAVPSQSKRGADKGVDGLMFFAIDKKNVGKIVVQVKSGKVSVRDIRDLIGTVEREAAVGGVFIMLNPPTKPMLTEAVQAGDYSVAWFPRRFQKIQILTIADILEGKQVEYPESLDVTFKKAQQTTEDLNQQFEF